MLRRSSLVDANGLVSFVFTIADHTLVPESIWDGRVNLITEQDDGELVSGKKLQYTLTPST